MKTKTSNLIFGILFIIIGIFMGLNSFGIYDLNLYIRDWWALIIILPFLFNMVEKGLTTSNFIGVIIGLILLLSSQELIPLNTLSKIIIPLILVVIGFKIIFKSRMPKDVYEKLHINTQGLLDYSAIFSGQDIKVASEKFEGANLTAVFGGIDLNLKDAIIEKDVVINTNAIFGGIDIIVPSDVKVKISSTPIFGGVSSKVNSNDENLKTIYINGLCVFGGIEIK